MQTLGEQLVKAGPLTILALALLATAVLGLALVVAAFKFIPPLWERFTDKAATSTADSARVVLGADLVMAQKLEGRVRDLEGARDRHTHHIGQLEDDVRSLRRETEATRLDVGKLQTTVDGLCENVSEGRKESREDMQELRRLLVEKRA